MSPTNWKEPIYHLTPAGYYHRQPADQPYRPAAFAEEGFIHCTAGAPKLIEVANIYFAGLQDELLVLEIDPARLDVPLIFEPPIPPPHATTLAPHNPNALFPHIYGPLNRQAIIACFSLERNPTGQWQMSR